MRSKETLAKEEAVTTNRMRLVGQIRKWLEEDAGDMLREMLGLPRSKVFVLGITVGYPDTESRANNVPRIRLPLEEWAHWHGL